MVFPYRSKASSFDRHWANRLVRPSVALLLVFVLGYLAGQRPPEIADRPVPVRLKERPDDRAPAGEDEDGWRTIHTYVGHTRDEETDHPASHNTTFLTYLGMRLRKEHKWYGQILQDELVWLLLNAIDQPSKLFASSDRSLLLNEAVMPMKKSNGQPYFFLDVAGNDARIISNSYALDIQYGWHGICMEPNPTYWYDHTRYRTQNSIFVASVAGNHSYPDEPLAFRYNNGVFGGIIGFDNGASSDPTHTEYTVSLAKVLQRFKAPSVIDYFSFDVEGAEFYSMSNFPFDSYRFRIVTIERAPQPLMDLLTTKGYVFITTIANFGEQLWVHETEHLELLRSTAIDFAGNVTAGIRLIQI
jgi:Methyltransferase FkbM domain